MVEIAWRIDAWDSLAGRAFLCLRAADDHSEPDLDRSSIFISPPFFQPEAVASRAPGFAACRGTYQAGLFVDGEEVGFETLADAIEFVRRGYISGRELPDPTPSPLGTPPRPTEGGGRGVALDIPQDTLGLGGRRLDAAVSKLVTKFHDAKNDLSSVGASRLCQWGIDDNGIIPSGIYEVLVFAAEALLRELIERLPTSHQIDDSIAWLESIRRLSRLVSLLNIDEEVWRYLRKLLDHLSSEFRERIADFTNRHIYARSQPSIDNALNDFVNQILARRWAFEENEREDVYDDISTLPLPGAIASKYCIGGSDPNLLTVLSAWFGHVGHADEMLDRALLIFGAACVVVGPLKRQNEIYRVPWLVGSVRQNFFERLGRDSWNWVSAQMPSRAFNQTMESLLREVPRIWNKTNDPLTTGPRPIGSEKPIDDLTSLEKSMILVLLEDALSDDELKLEFDYETESLSNDEGTGEAFPAGA